MSHVWLQNRTRIWQLREHTMHSSSLPSPPSADLHSTIYFSFVPLFHSDRHRKFSPLLVQCSSMRRIYIQGNSEFFRLLIAGLSRRKTEVMQQLECRVLCLECHYFTSFPPSFSLSFPPLFSPSLPFILHFVCIDPFHLVDLLFLLPRKLDITSLDENF